MTRQRRILELVIVLAIVACTTLFWKQGVHATDAPPPTPETPAAVPDFSARGVRLGMTEPEVVNLLGPSKGDRFNENRQRYLNFGDVDLMLEGDKVSVIYAQRVDADQKSSVAAGDQREDIQSALGEPFVPGPEPGPHRAPDYEFYRGKNCLLEVTYKGEQASLFSLYPDHQGD